MYNKTTNLLPEEKLLLMPPFTAVLHSKDNFTHILVQRLLCASAGAYESQQTAKRQQLNQKTELLTHLLVFIVAVFKSRQKLEKDLTLTNTNKQVTIFRKYKKGD